MRSAFKAFAVMLILLAAIFLLGFFADKAIGEAIGKLEASETNEGFDVAEGVVEKHDWLFSLILSDKSLGELELAITDCKSAIRAGDGKAWESAKSRLILTLREMRRQNGLNIYSIF